MAINQEIRDYINQAIKESLSNLQVDTLAVGSFDENAQIGSRKEGSQIAKNTLISGTNNQAKADHSAAIGSNNEVGDMANSAVSLGEGTQAFSPYQLVHGKYNESDSNNIYAHIIGGGTGPAIGDRKNIYTLDWEGNATFAGSIKSHKHPSSKEDLVTIEYLQKNIPIKIYPHTIKNNMLNICANDLEAYTIYKVDTSGEFNRIKFTIKNDQGRDIEFLSADSNINKYNMFIGAKTDDIAMLYINDVIYELDLHTGKFKQSYDDKYTDKTPSGSGNIDASDIIDDKTNDPNKTWSSEKLSSMLENVQQSLNEAYNNVVLEIDDRGNLSDNKADLVFYNDNTELNRVHLPVSYFITVEDIMRWNDVEKKLDMPDVHGSVGQILALKEVRLDGVETEWIDQNELEIDTLTQEEVEELKSMFMINDKK